MLNHLHSNAIKKYYENPKKCLLCNKIIRVGNKKVSQIRKKIFCNLSCSSSYNNKKYPERYRFAKKTGKCKNCHRKIYYKKRKNEGGYVRKKYCSICLPIMRAKGNPISETTKRRIV